MQTTHKPAVTAFLILVAALGLKGEVRALEALERVAEFDSHCDSIGGESEPSNPWAYDHTGGSSDYWSEKDEPVVYVYPVRDAARRALEAIKQKA